MSTQFDIVVVGGGLVGAAAAVALKLQGFSVALLDKALPITLESESKTWDARIYAISPSNAEWLSTLGVWGILDQSRVSRVDAMQVYGDSADAQLNFDAYQANVSELSFILENNQLQSALWKKMQMIGVYIETGVQLETLMYDTNGANLTIADGRTFSAKLIIGADGANSWVRQQSGFAVQKHDYHHCGLVANFTTERAHQNIARQWFSEGAVLAWLPLPQNRISIVWSTSTYHVESLRNLETESFVEKVAEAGAHALGQLKLLTPPVAFPLALQEANALVKSNIVLIGDAAHLVHPLAGQGVNLGFRDVIDLVKVLKFKHAYEHIGDVMVLRRYERRRKQDILTIKTLTHGLHVLFAQEKSLLKRVRNWGLQQINQQARVKKLLIQQAIK